MTGIKLITAAKELMIVVDRLIGYLEHSIQLNLVYLVIVKARETKL